MEGRRKLGIERHIDSSLEREKYKELLFRTEVESRLIESFVDALEQNNFSEDEIFEFRQAIVNISDLDRQVLVSSPWKLKQIYLKELKNKVDGGMTMQEVVEDIIEKNKKFKRGYAYHTSNEDIKPREVNVAGKKSLEWVVGATEKDHRDDDLPRAYMSFDYHSLYRDKNPKYLYIVGYRKGENTGFISNKLDNWGRASGLDIIDKIDLTEIDERINKAVKEKEEGASLIRKRA